MTKRVGTPNALARDRSKDKEGNQTQSYMLSASINQEKAKGREQQDIHAIHKEGGGKGFSLKPC